MPFGVSSGIPNVIIQAKFHVDRLRGFWAAGPPKVPFPILISFTVMVMVRVSYSFTVTVSIRVIVEFGHSELALEFGHSEL